MIQYILRPVFVFLFGIVHPQCGQINALPLISFSHSRQVINAIHFPPMIRLLNTDDSMKTGITLKVCIKLLQQGYKPNENLGKVFAAGLDKTPILDFPPRNQIAHLLDES